MLVCGSFIPEKSIHSLGFVDTTGVFDSKNVMATNSRSYVLTKRKI
jgi:hypothetical protein